MNTSNGASGPIHDEAGLRTMRWSMGLLWAAGVAVMLGFLTTQWLSDGSAERLGSPSKNAVARERVPSSESFTVDRPGTYDLYYEQEAPSVGVPRSLDVTISSEVGELSLDTPDAVFSTAVDQRSYITFRTVTIPRSGTYKLDVTLGAGAQDDAPNSDDRVVVDRVDRSTDALWVLLGLTPAAAGMALGACLVAASVWLRTRTLKSLRGGDGQGQGPPNHPWGPPASQPFRDASPPPDASGPAGPHGDGDLGSQDSVDRGN